MPTDAKLRYWRVTLAVWGKSIEAGEEHLSYLIAQHANDNNVTLESIEKEPGR